MIRSITTFIQLVLFGVSLVIGYNLVGKIVNDRQAAQTPQVTDYQINILIAGIDQDSQGEKRLASAWAALIKISDNSSLAFMKFYPDPGSEKDRKDAASGYLKLNGSRLPDSFTQKMAALDLNFVDTILIDRSNLGAIAPFFSKNVTPTPAADRTKGAAAVSEEEYFKSLCESLTAAGTSPQEPASASTPDASNWMVQWKRLVTSLHFSSCKVVVKP